MCAYTCTEEYPVHPFLTFVYVQFTFGRKYQGGEKLAWRLLRNEVTVPTMIENDAQVLVNEKFTDICLTPRLC